MQQRHGKLVWKKQLGTSSDDYSWGVATDRQGNVLIVTNDFVAKYSPKGSLLWKKKLDIYGDNYSWGVATDRQGNVLIVTNDFVAKYSPKGSLLWKKELDSFGDDSSWGIATDSQGNVLITGDDVSYSGGGSYTGDSFVAKYSPNGMLLWKKKLVVQDGYLNWARAVATDSRGNVFVSGFTDGSFAGQNKGLYDAWVAKYDPNGKLVWKKQLGTSDFDYSGGVATDRQGNVFISGYTTPDLFSYGGEFAWVARYSSDGKLIWWRRERTLGVTSAFDVTTDNNGHVLVTGDTSGDLGD
jgi:hypothetical protein